MHLITKLAQHNRLAIFDSYQTNSAFCRFDLYLWVLDGTDGLFSCPYTIPEFEMIGCDIDGEPVQSEQVRVFKSEGFYSYQLGECSWGLTAEESADGNSVLFTGTRY